MTTACIFKDTLRNHAQMFLKFKDSILEICLRLINLNCTLDSYLSLMLSSGVGTSKEIPLQESGFALPAKLITLPIFIHWYQLLAWQLFSILIFKMTSNISMASSDSNVFYLEQISNESSLQRNNSVNILNSTDISEQHTARMPSVSSIASAEPRMFTIDDDSNEPTMPYGFGRQLPIVPPSLNDLNLPPIPFNILNTMAVVTQIHDDNNKYIPQSPESSDPSPISTPPMNVSTFSSWETPHTTTDDNTFYSSDEPRRVYWTSPADEAFDSEDKPKRIYVLFSPLPLPHRKMKRKLEIGMSFPKEKEVSQHVCETCGQVIPAVKDIPGPSSRN